MQFRLHINGVCIIILLISLFIHVKFSTVLSKTQIVVKEKQTIISFHNFLFMITSLILFGQKNRKGLVFKKSLYASISFQYKYESFLDSASAKRSNALTGEASDSSACLRLRKKTHCVYAGLWNSHQQVSISSIRLSSQLKTSPQIM